MAKRLSPKEEFQVRVLVGPPFLRGILTTIMRTAAWLSSIALVVAVLALPDAALAQVVAQCTGIDCQLCHLFDLFNNVIQYAILIGSAIAACAFAYAGALMVFAAGDTGKIASSKKIFGTVILGYVIALIGVLMVDVLVNSLAQGKLAWKSAPCSNNRLLTGGIRFNNDQIAIIGQTQRGYLGSAEDTIILQPGSGQRTDSIQAAAALFEGTSSYNAPGTNNGDLACVWAVNQVLQIAGIPPVDHLSVPEMERELKGGRGAAVDAAFAQPGDIVIRGDTGHVGICKTSGCTQIISNSSGARSFTNNQNQQGFSTYRGTTHTSRVYRIVK